jgi:4-diphosphocytidyl-2-C-methyl-D-erythritol kinase
MIGLPSFAKINLGLKIGPRRSDGFHELRTIYQTLAVHDVVLVSVEAGKGIEIRCNDARVPLDHSNTCNKIAERLLAAMSEAEQSSSPGAQQVPPLRPAGSGRNDKQLGVVNGLPRDKIVIEIEKRLPVQGGVGAASSNAVATMLALERALAVELSPADKLRIAAAVGSDLPLFLIGGTVLGVGRGEEVYPLPDLPLMHVVVVTPAIGVSTPRAFAHWDEVAAREAALTPPEAAGTINEFSGRVLTWLGKSFPQALGSASGVPAAGGDRAETPLLDLVRAGIENDFERVVFPEYPDLREVKELLLCEGAQYASLSGSGSTLYGLFASESDARAAAERMSAAGHQAITTTTLTRAEYWQRLAVHD